MGLQRHIITELDFETISKYGFVVHIPNLDGITHLFQRDGFAGWYWSERCGVSLTRHNFKDIRFQSRLCCLDSDIDWHKSIVEAHMLRAL